MTDHWNSHYDDPYHCGCKRVDAPPAAPDVPPRPFLEWDGPDEEGDHLVFLRGVVNAHLLAHGQTPEIALSRLAEAILLAFPLPDLPVE